MNKQLIKSELKSLNQAYGQSYDDIMIVLQEIINDRNTRNNYIIDLEGDPIFNGTYVECERFIKDNRIYKKSNVKEYGLTTPTEDNIVLCNSVEFSHLFK